MQMARFPSRRSFTMRTGSRSHGRVDAAHAILSAGEAQSVTLSGVVKTPRKWSAEDPYLYTLVLAETSGEKTVYESCQVGFRKMTYKTNASGWFEGSTATPTSSASTGSRFPCAASTATRRTPNTGTP